MFEATKEEAHGEREQIWSALHALGEEMRVLRKAAEKTAASAD